MASRTRKIVFTPERGDLEEIDQVIRSARYSSVSSFVREAVREKLLRLRDEEMFAAVEEYCRVGVENTDDLMAAQALDDE
jgi:Arc/MetJ-type ribon-helix-helix transcriptional regulator